MIGNFAKVVAINVLNSNKERGVNDMSTFKSDKVIPTRLKDLRIVLKNMKEYFENKGYIVSVEENAMGYFISISKGGMFKAVLGMKTALNIDIRVLSEGVSASAKVGIFGQQLVPSMISLFIAWPILVTQITGLVSQAKLDDEALDVLEQSIRDYEMNNGVTANNTIMFCTSCGTALKLESVYCTECGEQQ